MGTPQLLQPGRGMRLRGFHPIFLFHHPTVLLVVLLVVVLVLLVLKYRSR